MADKDIESISSGSVELSGLELVYLAGRIRHFTEDQGPKYNLTGLDEYIQRILRGDLVHPSSLESIMRSEMAAESVQLIVDTKDGVARVVYNLQIKPMNKMKFKIGVLDESGLKSSRNGPGDKDWPRESAGKYGAVMPNHHGLTLKAGLPGEGNVRITLLIRKNLIDLITPLTGDDRRTGAGENNFPIKNEKIK